MCCDSLVHIDTTGNKKKKSEEKTLRSRCVLAQFGVMLEALVA